MTQSNLDSSRGRHYQQALLEYFSQYVTENKKAHFERVLGQRTRHLTVVLEDIFKPHNASAVMRTAECMGIQDTHIVEQRNAYDYNPYVLRGSGKWLTFHRYDKSDRNIELCYDRLHAEGYQILATSPHANAQNYDDVVINQKTAVVFGTEETGISDYARDHADGLIQIPMMGFTESYNISVSAAIILENYNNQIRKNMDCALTQDEYFALKCEWYQKVVTHYPTHIREFNRKYDATLQK